MSRSQRASRQEFSRPTRRKIAARAGYRCSIPTCNRLTIGPGSQSSEFAVTGDAAHIYPASSMGPRGSVITSEIELRSIENAIWVCKDHHGLIDANRGSRYPSALLLKYKALHEARIAREQGGRFTKIAWFEEFILHDTPIFEKSERLRFSKVTVLLGENFSGKTALCELLAGVADEGARARWQSPPQNEHVRLDVELLYFDPEQNGVRLRIGSDGATQFTIGGRSYPFCAAPVRFVMLKEPPVAVNPEIDDLDLIGTQLGISRERVLSLLPCVNTNGNSVVCNLRTESAEGTVRVRADVKGTKPSLWFRALSHSEQTFVLFELAVAMATASSEFVPTMLLLEGLWRLDKRVFQAWAERLNAAEHPFQTVIVLPSSTVSISDWRWTGWQVAQLAKTAKATRIIQNLE